MRPSSICWALCLALAACSGGSGGNPDAGGEQRTLEILDPPGDSLGLPLSGSVTLRVRYLRGDGVAIGGERVTFELVAGNSEAIGAAALSALSASTDGGGIAEVSLTAGASEANFRVRASAPGAPPATFFVVVSDAGFANIDVSPSHGGPRAAADFGNLEYRLFSPDQIECAGLDVDALPDSVFPPRRGAGFDEPVEFRNLAAARPYVLLAWGEHEQGGARLAAGCVELSAEQVRVGPTLELSLELADRPLLWAEPLPITSALVFPDLTDEIDAALAPDPWRSLACPLGPAQLILDCSLDAAVSDGALDCAVGGSGALIDDIEAQRGAPDAAGCRPDEVAPGTPSLDRALLDAMTAGPFTEEDAALLATARDQLLSGARIGSELSLDGPAALRQQLRTLTLVAGGGSRTTDLVASARPVLAAVVAVAFDDAGVATLGRGDFTLTLRGAAEDMFVNQLLPDRGLAGRQSDLGAALAASFDDGAGATGCDAVSAIACSAASRPATCLAAGCSAAAAALDARLLAWLDVLDAAGLDFSLSGSAQIEDRDFDRSVDTVGAGPTLLEGSWDVQLVTGAGTSLGVGAFGGER